MDPIKAELIQQCPFCTHIFYAPREEQILMCPGCKSLIHQEEMKN